MFRRENYLNKYSVRQKYNNVEPRPLETPDLRNIRQKNQLNYILNKLKMKMCSLALYVKKQESTEENLKDSLTWVWEVTNQNGNYHLARIMNGKAIILPEETEMFCISFQVGMLLVQTWVQMLSSHTKTYASCGTSTSWNSKQLRNAEKWGNSLRQGRAYQLIIQYQGVSPENIQATLYAVFRYLVINTSQTYIDAC